LWTFQVVSTGPNPEFDESFSWTFESPPKGQKLHISCKNKSKMGKVINGTEFIFLVRKQIKKGVSMFIHILSEIFSSHCHLTCLFWSNNRVLSEK
jgi:hypothetical protein